MFDLLAPVYAEEQGSSTGVSPENGGDCTESDEHKLDMSVGHKDRGEVI